MKTKVTSKYQTTIPEKIRKALNVKPGQEVEWELIRAMAIVHTRRKIKDPVKVLTGQIKSDIDAVKLVREVREEMV